MKIESYGQAKVGPQAVRTPVGEVAMPRDHMSGALAQLDQFGGQALGVLAKAQKEAEVIEARDQLNELEKRGTARWAGDSTGILPARAGDITQPGQRREGFISVRGKAAADKSTKVMEDFDGDIQELSGKLKSETARKIFTAEAAERRQGLLRQVEGHVAGETERAKVDSIKVATDNAVRDASLSADDDELAGDRIASAAAAAAEMASSPEAAESQALDIQAQISRARLDQLLADSKVGSAERVLNANRRALGDDAAKYERHINEVKLGTQAQQAALDVVAKGLKDDGQVDQTVVLDQLSKVAPELREKVAPIAYRMMGEREQAYAAETQRIGRASFALFNAKGWGEFQKSGLSTELNYRNPELYNRLRDDARAQFDRAKRLKRDSAEDRRRQQELNKVAVQEFAALPTEQQANSDIGEFLLNRGTAGVSSPKDPVPSAIAALQKKARDQVEKGLAVDVDTFIGDVRASLRKHAPEPGATKASRAKAASWWSEQLADARTRYNLWLDNNPTKKPTRDDLEEMKGGVIGDLVPNPKNPESIADVARAQSSRAGGAGGRPRGPQYVDVPAADRAQIEAALKAKGRVITEDAVQTLYKQVRGGR